MSEPASEPTEGGGSNLTRVTVNLTPRAVEAMEVACRTDGIGKTDVINRALGLYQIVTAERASGARVLLERANGERVEVMFL